MIKENQDLIDFNKCLRISLHLLLKSNGLKALTLKSMINNTFYHHEKNFLHRLNRKEKDKNKMKSLKSKLKLMKNHSINILVTG